MRSAFRERGHGSKVAVWTAGVAVAREHRAADAGPLTTRECEIVCWVAEGKTDAQIATILGRSVRTVQKHLEHVYVKLGVENRTAAAMCAQRAGLLARRR